MRHHTGTPTSSCYSWSTIELGEHRFVCLTSSAMRRLRPPTVGALGEARENKLEAPGELTKATHRGTTLKQLLEAYMADPDVRMGHSKESHLKVLQGTDLGDMDLSEIRQLQIIAHVRDRLETGSLPVTVNNDLIWLRTVARWALSFDKYRISIEEIEKALVYCRQHRFVQRFS